MRALLFSSTNDDWFLDEGSWPWRSVSSSSMLSTLRSSKLSWLSRELWREEQRGAFEEALFSGEIGSPARGRVLDRTFSNFRLNVACSSSLFLLLSRLARLLRVLSSRGLESSDGRVSVSILHSCETCELGWDNCESRQVGLVSVRFWRPSCALSCPWSVLILFCSSRKLLHLEKSNDGNEMK